MELMTPSSFEAASRSRRARRPRPCDACRRNKTKCVVKDSKHACLQCQTRDSVCAFNQAPPERKQPSRRDEQVQRESVPDAERRGSVTSQTNSPMMGRTQTTEPAPDPILGLHSDRFAELYGLGSDMEPILMVSVPYHPHQR